MQTNRFTPATIGDLMFTIPLYQRLFEWEEKQVSQLLHDLFISFQNTPDKPYYIGMLTAFKEGGVLSLVDGQQRFTVLTLMGIAFGSSYWKKFVKANPGTYRLSFFGRKDDEGYLKRRNEKLGTGSSYVNTKMDDAIRIIEEFWKSRQYIPEFAEYIYNNATFFISELPASYNYRDLNKYFESMNADGKGLENHEILKVELLRKLGDRKEFYTKIWNSVSQMDRCLLQRGENEKGEDFKRRYQILIQNMHDVKSMFELCGFEMTSSAGVEFKSIRDIGLSSESPKKALDSRSERSMLDFPEFLLQVLWLCLNLTQEEKSKEVFFNKQKLLETFSEFEKKLDAEKFFHLLFSYRAIFDYYILRIDRTGDGEVDYILNFSDAADTQGNARLLLYQSMLYVSTISHNWLTEILKHLYSTQEVKAASYLEVLKGQDDSRCRKRSKEFEFGHIDRYWFWRLDYYLLERKDEFFNGKALDIARKYIFKANRSIEHIAPQSPKRYTDVTVPDDELDSFGNLVMISSGQNSSLQNECFEVKRAHVESYINGSRVGSIESLKMLVVYSYGVWNEDNVREHAGQMLKVLADSFTPEFSDIGDRIRQKRLEAIGQNTVA